MEIKWDIRRSGRAWRGDEARQCYNLTPEKFEMDEGKLFLGEDLVREGLGHLARGVCPGVETDPAG